MRTIRGLALTAVLGAGVALAPAPAAAQVIFGAEAAFGTEQDFGIGGRIHTDLGASAANLELMGSFLLFFPDGPRDYWEINGNVLYHFPRRAASTAQPYAGGGLNIAHTSRDGDFDDTDLGFNLAGGVRFLFANTIPFLEARVTFGHDEQLVIGGGVLFGSW